MFARSGEGVAGQRCGGQSRRLAEQRVLERGPRARRPSERQAHGRRDRILRSTQRLAALRVGRGSSRVRVLEELRHGHQHRRRNREVDDHDGREDPHLSDGSREDDKRDN